MSELAKVEQGSIDDEWQDDTDITFSVFGTDETAEVDLGLGKSVTSAQFNDSVKVKDNEGKPSEKRETNRESIFDKYKNMTREDINKEIEDLEIYSNDIETNILAKARDKIRSEERKKKLKQMGDEIFSKSIDDAIDTEQSTGSFTIIDTDEVKDNQYEVDLNDLTTKFEEEQKKKNTIIKEKVIEKDKKTFLDRIGLAIMWLMNTFIVAPVKGLFKALYAGMFSVLGYFGGLLKFLLVSIVITAIFLVLYTNFVNPDLSAQDIALQNFEIVKEVVVKLSLDVWGVIQSMFSK